MRSRTRARETALKYLYEHDLRGADACPSPEEYLSRLGLHPSVGDFARGIIEGVLSELQALNREIESAARNWRLKRMSAIDRNVIRIGAFEILRSPDVPVEVAINEAVEIARRYGSAQSAAFVNGILDKILETSGRRPAQANAEPPEERCSDSD